MSRPMDTSFDARRRQVDAYRSMTPGERLRLADAMSSDVRSLAVAGIRARHPEYSADDQAAALAEILLGRGRPSGSRRPRRHAGKT
jgi:hypothetical protein